MSQLIAQVQVTLTAPVGHAVINFGRECGAVVFTHDGKTYTLNRRGKSNVKGFVGRKRGVQTLTLTNGSERFTRLPEAQVKVLGFVSVAGVWHDFS